MKFKPNKLNYYRAPARDYDAYIFPFAIDYPDKKRGFGLSLTVGIRELKEGRITLDTLEDKLDAAARTLRDLMFFGDVEPRKRLIKELQKSLKYT